MVEVRSGRITPGSRLSTEGAPSVLLGGEGHPRALPPSRFPSVGGRSGERAEGRAGNPGRQPPVVRRPFLRSALPAAQGDLPRQVRLLHGPGHQGPAQQGLLQRRRHRSHRPLRRQGQRGGTPYGQAHPERGPGARHLPRGHPLPRRPPLQGQDRRGPAGAGVPRAGDPVGDGQHLRDDAPRPCPPQAGHPSRGEVRQAAGLLPLLRDGGGLASSCAPSPTRSCTR